MRKEKVGESEVTAVRWADSYAPSRCALAVVAKAPRAGEVKTRLAPALTVGEAASLAGCLLADVAANVAEVAARTDAYGVLVFSPAGAEAAFEGLLPDGFGMLAQRGAGLGERLVNACEDLFARGCGALCLINADGPTLPPAYLERAVNALKLPGERIVLGPAEDGGYYLVGLSRPNPHLFDAIEWSTSSVLSQTLERAAAVGLEVEMLPAWYDVDDPASLRRLRDELFSTRADAPHPSPPYHAPHTRAFLASRIVK